MLAVLSPVWQGRNIAITNLGNVFSSIRSRDDLVKENIALKERLASYDAAFLSCRTDRDALATLLTSFNREDLVFNADVATTSSSTRSLGIMTKKASAIHIAASVLAAPPETPYDTIIIDAGSHDGIEVGDKVTLPEGAAIGEVEAVFTSTAKAILFTSNSEETNGVLERNLVPVTLIGRGGGNAEIHLPRDTEVKVGDRVLSPELLGGVMAIVGSVEVSPTDAFKRVLVRSAANMNMLRYVTILK